jgi:alpha(1,3/1,4) fucosyltransferase
MKPRIRLGFRDFWHDFDPLDNYFLDLLGEAYDVEVCEQPDFLIYSCFGQEFRHYPGVRIFFTGENVRPNFTECDYAFSFDFCEHPDHVRMPLWRMASRWRPLESKQNFDPRKVLAEKTKFCNFIYSNKYCPTRNRFFRMLSKYKRVDSAGRVFNNIGGKLGGRIADKLEYLGPYKFTIAFENESYRGYTTEKIYHAMIANSLPIYWGNPRVDVDFNPASFLNYWEYGSLNALLERVIEVDQDDDLYCQYLRQPWYPENAINEADFTEMMLAKFQRIFFTTRVPVAQRSRSAKYFIIEPPRRAAALIRNKSVRLARKIRYRLNVLGS